MKTIYAVIVSMCASMFLNAMNFMQAPPPPPPDPNSNGIGGNNAPIDGIVPLLFITSVLLISWWAYNRRKKISQ